jgi:hypothetical protein
MRLAKVSHLEFMERLRAVSLRHSEENKRLAILQGLSNKARQNGMFAVSEICKGIVIIEIGDFATADFTGEFICGALQTVFSLMVMLPYDISRFNAARRIRVNPGH